MPMYVRVFLWSWSSRFDTAGEIRDSHARTERNDASLLGLARLDRLARHPRADAMDRDPARCVMAVRLDDSFDPYIVGRQLGELVLELLDVDGMVDGEPHAVDSMCSRAVEMTTVVAVEVVDNLAIRLGNLP